MQRVAVIQYYSSMCSGSLVTQKFILLSFQPSEWYHKLFQRSAESLCLAIRQWFMQQHPLRSFRL